jgi:hypothetical protein
MSATNAWDALVADNLASIDSSHICTSAAHTRMTAADGKSCREENNNKGRLNREMIHRCPTVRQDAHIPVCVEREFHSELLLFAAGTWRICRRKFAER